MISSWNVQYKKNKRSSLTQPNCCQPEHGVPTVDGAAPNAFDILVGLFFNILFLRKYIFIVVGSIFRQCYKRNKTTLLFLKIMSNQFIERDIHLFATDKGIYKVNISSKTHCRKLTFEVQFQFFTKVRTIKIRQT